MHNKIHEKRATILVIDDDKGIRDSFTSLLTEKGHQVLAADNYLTGIGLIDSCEPDLIFVDLFLGNHTGIEVLKQVRIRGMEIPVVIITGHPVVDNAADSFRLGAFDYLAKPVPSNALFRVTSMALRQKALTDQNKAIEAEREIYRNHLEAIFRSVSDAIITIDNKREIIQSNLAVKKVLKIEPEKIIGCKADEIFCKGLCSCLKDTLVYKKTIMDCRIEALDKNNQNQILLLNSSPLLDQKNLSIGAVLIIKDITRISEMEKKLKERSGFHGIVGKSPLMQEIYRLVQNLADMNTTVLITGESGTGKELIARAIHYSGSRSLKPFIPVNCSALSENILESELFGHVKGAFTGAFKNKDGRFQSAHKGTIFLDEIGDISPLVQVKLLRILQEKEFERVGDTKSIKTDVRIIAATNRQLKHDVHTGRFRKDLYYRLKVIEIVVPPLRDRIEDIHPLVRHFLDFFNKTFKKQIEAVTENVLKAFKAYPWPGNIRELKHALEHAFVMCRNNTITLENLPREIHENNEQGKNIEKMPDTGELENIIRTLEKTGWNKTRTAKLLGMSRQTLYRKLQKHKIAPGL